MSCRKLLVLYTGGTVGIWMSATGLVASGFEARLLLSAQALDAQPLP
jgi:L-asparaginase